MSNNAHPVPHTLEMIALGKLSPEPLSVTYSDLHGFHGGLTLVIKGDGTTEQAYSRVPVGELRSHISAEEIRALAQHLVALRAWEQQVPDRMAVPDESKAYLLIRVGDHESRMWEWFNDLESNQRLERIREFMKQIAWRE